MEISNKTRLSAIQAIVNQTLDAGYDADCGSVLFEVMEEIRELACGPYSPEGTTQGGTR